MAEVYTWRVSNRDFVTLLKIDMDHYEQHGSVTTSKFFEALTTMTYWRA